MKPTPAQKQTLVEYRKAFGKDVIKAHAPRKRDGMMLVEATAKAGVWEWTIRPDGTLARAWLTMPMFDEPKTGQPRPGTLDEQFSATQTQRSRHDTA